MLQDYQKKNLTTEMVEVIEAHKGDFELNWFCFVENTQKVARAEDPALMLNLLTKNSTFEFCGETLVLTR